MTASVTPQRYRAWLQAHPPTAVVGLRQHCFACVVATWLLATHPHGCAGVWVDGWTDGRGHWRRLPDWAQAQIHALDAPGMPRQITAALALQTLENTR